MWVRWKYAEHSAAFNNPLLFELHGPLDVERLAAAYDALVDRYDVLRVRFVESGDAVVQEITPRQGPALDVHDLAGLPDALREKRKQALVDAVVSAPFDLARDPVYRFALVRLAADHHVLLMNIHHICTDGVSAAILLAEIAADYKGENPPPPIGESIERFIELEAQTPPAEREEAERYWAEVLQNAQPWVDFGSVQRTDVERSDRGSRRYVFKLQAEERKAVAAMAKRTRSTLFMVLVAALDILLWRYTGQSSLTLVFPIDIRPSTYKLQFGCMINYLPVALSLDREMTVAELIQAAVAARAGSRKYMSFPHLDISRIARKRGRPFNTAITAANFALDVFSLEGLEVRPQLVFSGEAKEDLGLLFDAQGSELVMIFEYRRALLEDELIHEMAADLIHLLVEMAANEGRRLDELTLRGDRPFAERYFARESDAAPAGEDLSALFHARLGAAGERVVATGESRMLSGRTLLGLTAGVVELLRERGVGPRDRVAVQLSRSPLLLSVILGIWKLGAIYVPLDPDLPPARKRFILDHAAPGLVLTDADLVGLEARESRDDAPDRGDVAADDLAYIIYTSGSTGQPKGVEVTRANLVSFLRAMEQRLPVDSRSRLLAVTTIGFDISLLELFLPLLVGATVFIYPAESVRDAFALPALLERERIDVLQATPSFFRMLIAAGWTGKSDLVALAGGEHLESATAQVLLRGCRELWNLYGPTETTVWSMAARIEDGAAVDLGRPILGTSIEVLGPNGLLVPRYGRGEIHIRGPGVASGYRGRPDLSAERFVQLPGGRAYRTGDIALRSGNDTLHFVGRVDHQVKIRGFRVELGEIEAQLEALSEVQKAVVLTFTGASRERTLAAFVEPSEGGRIDERALRSSLAKTLPLYMLPAVIRTVRQWPVSPSGKIDRRALEHELEASSAPSPQLTASPAGDPDALAQALTRIYSDVLGSAPADRSRNLFELGGDSLSGARIVARVRDELSLALPFQPFMADSSLDGALRLALAAERVAPAERSEHSGRAHTRRDFPLPAGSLRVLLSDRVLGRSFQNTLGRLFVIDGPVDIERLRTATESALSDFLLDRWRLETDARAWVIPEDDAAFRYWNEIELDAPYHDVLALCLRWLETPLDPARGHSFKCLVVRTGDRNYLALAAHHAALDGASSHRFLRAVSSRYLGSAGPEGPEGPEGFDIAQTERYVESARRRAEVERDAVLAHVRGRLGGWAYFELGAPIAPYDPDASRTMTLTFDSQAARALSARVRAAGVGQFAFFVALLVRSLAAQKAVEDVCLGVVHSLRDPIADRNVFGNLTNVLPVHVRAVRQRDPESLARDIQAQLLADQAHTAVPFQTLIDELPECRKLGLPPMFSVLAVEELVGDDALTLGEHTTVHSIDSGFTTNLYDLTMRVQIAEHGRVGFDYNTTRVDRKTIAAIANGVAAVAGGGVHEGEDRPARSPVAAAPSRDRVESADPEAIAAIIDEVLGEQSSDRERSFLASGGNSITAARAVALLHARLGIDARLYDFLTVPSLRELIESLVSGPASRSRLAGPQQQAIFFMHEAARCKAAYNIPVALRIEPNLAIDRLRAVVDEIVAQEPVLRARFQRSASGVVETTLPAAPSIVEVHGPVDQETFARMADESISRPFDLAQDLLLRVHHFSRDDGADALLIVFHHLIADGVSCGNFLRRLAQAYQGHALATPGSREDAVAAAEREGRLEQFLAEFPLRDERAALPYARPFPGARTLEGSTYEIELTSDQRAALGALSMARGLPMSALVFAAVSFALHHVSREHRINIGIATMNRTAENVNALGLYTNTVVLPVSLDPLELVERALDRLAGELFSVCRYADVPFPDVASRVMQSPDLGVTPLFQAFFNFIDRGIYTFETDAFRAAEIPLRPKGSKFELSFEIHDLGDTMRIVLEYSTDVFDRSAVEAMGELLRRILTALGRSLDKPLQRMLRSVR